MPTRVERRYAAVDGVPILCIIRSGDRSTPRDLTVGVRAQLAPGTTTFDDQRLLRAVHALAPLHVAAEPEAFALALARHCLARMNGVLRVDASVAERTWARLDIGGRPRDRDLVRTFGSVRTAHAQAGGDTSRVAAGLAGLRLLRGPDAETAAGVLTIVRLTARWTYGWEEVPFDTQWQQVRRALLEACAERPHAAGAALADALARAVLDESPAVARIRLRLRLERRGTVDLAPYGMENDGVVHGGADPARGVHSLVLGREEL